MTTSEQWKPLDGYEGRYEISDQGGLMSIKNGERFRRKLNAATHYMSFSCARRSEERSQKTFYMHQVVASHFIGPRPEGHVIRHLNGNRFDNRVCNLAYGLPEDNAADAIRHKTYAGENNGRSVLLTQTVKAIKLLLKHHVPCKEIAQAVGVSEWAIRAIASGRNWKDA